VGTDLTTTGVIADAEDHSLTVNGRLIAQNASFKDIESLTVTGIGAVLQADIATFEKVSTLVVSGVNTENYARSAEAVTIGGWLGADGATFEKAESITIGDNGVFESASAKITLPEKAVIRLGKGASFTASAPKDNTFANVEELYIGPASKVQLTSINVSLAGLKNLHVQDSASLTSAGTYAFTLDNPVGLGKGALITGKYASDAKVDIVYSGDTTLAAGTYNVTEKSTLAVAEGAILTVPEDAILDLSALKLPNTQAPDAPVAIKGTIKVASGGTVIGPFLSEQERPSVYSIFDLGTGGKILLNNGATFKFGTGTTAGTDVEYIAGASTGDFAFEWASNDDGAQIEINTAGFTIRDIGGTASDGITTDAKISTGKAATILKEQSLTLEAGTTLDIGVVANTLVLTGDAAGGAKLLGTGKVTAGAAEIVGGPGWQAFGGAGTITIAYASAVTSSITASVAGTVFKALGSGATITQKAGADNNLSIGVATVIELGGNEKAAGGVIILKNSAETDVTKSGKLTLGDAATKITTGNTSTAQGTAVVVAGDYKTAASGTTISAIGLPQLKGDGTNAKAIANITAVDSKVPSGNLISLEGGTGTITGGDATANGADGSISSLTMTVAL
jgi:hypothetical protein